MEETLTRQIKIYCPQHQSVFEVADSPKIVCEIREHALSNNFPNSEFWEYCCDCRIFSPSNLEVGGKANEVCSQCERKTIRRFICSECKTISFDSGEDTKGKIFHLKTDTEAIVPACPGCLRNLSAETLHLHKCEEAQTILLTSRKDCPFCKKEISPPAKKTTAPPVKPITETPKTMLLGSICPTCGAGNESDSVFCANCGQGLKPTTSQPPQNPPPPIPPNILPIPVQTAANVQSAAKVKSGNTNGCLAVIGIVFGMIILGAIILAISYNKNSTKSSANTNYNLSSTNSIKSSTPNTPTMNSNRTIDNTNKTNSNSSLPSSSSRDYTGTINGRYLTMSLTRSGSTLEGTASTSRTDKLYGTIDGSSNFTLSAYENDGSYQSGIYKGRIYSDGSISGTWTNPQGGQGTSFSLTED